MAVEWTSITNHLYFPGRRTSCYTCGEPLSHHLGDGRLTPHEPRWELGCRCNQCKGAELRRKEMAK